MTAKIFTRHAAIQAKRMYEERDSRGRRVWSHMRLAKFFCVSETTVFRAIQSLGAYMDLPEEVPTGEGLKDAAQESLAKLLRENPDIAPEGMLEKVEQSAAEKMAAAIREEREKAGRGDALLEELRGGSDAAKKD